MVGFGQFTASERVRELAVAPSPAAPTLRTELYGRLQCTENGQNRLKPILLLTGKHKKGYG